MPITDSFRIRADLIIAARDRVYAPGVITISHRHVIDVRPANRSSDPVDLDLEGYALLPGLVNPHTHLEFSDLAVPLPAGQSFPEWIGRVIRQRLSRGEDAQQLLLQSLTQGVIECRQAGVSAVADIVTPPWTPDLLDSLQLPDIPLPSMSHSIVSQRLRADGLELFQKHMQPASAFPMVVACLEILGVTGDRAIQLRRWRDEILTTASDLPHGRLLDLGYSPHAPYSTPQDLWSESAGLGARDRRLVVMHLAESPAEREWIDSGSGPMSAMLDRIGATNHHPQADWIEQAIGQLARTPRALIVHGNYLTDREMDRIAADRDHLSVVYCPRTHAHFGHDAYPLERLIARGIRVVLGTDSRSSNPDLNLWQEAAAAVARHADLRPSQALDAITQSAAEALGIAPRFGTLLPGALAAISAVPTFGLSDVDELLSRNFAETQSVLPVAQ